MKHEQTCHARADLFAGWRWGRWPRRQAVPSRSRTTTLICVSCAACHGPELRGGETGPALLGSEFQQRWSQKPTGELETFTRTRMPPTNPGSLTNRDLAVVINRIRRANSWPVSASSAGGRRRRRRQASLHGVAQQSRRSREHELLAARADQSRQRALAAHRVALEVRQLRAVARVLLSRHAADGGWRALHHRGHAPNRCRDRCGDWRDAVDVSARRRCAWHGRAAQKLGARRFVLAQPEWRASRTGSTRFRRAFSSSRSMRAPGQPIPSFGERGLVDLKTDCRESTISRQVAVDRAHRR